MNRTAFKKLGRIAAATVLATSALAAAGATSAQAASKDGVINTGEFVQWYYTNYNGGCEDDYYGDSTFWNDYFRNCGQGLSGVGQRVANNAESDFNYDYSYSADVYTGVSYTGSHGVVLPRRGGNYTSTYKHHVESLRWHL